MDLASDVDVFRGFNRAYTRIIGTLDEAFLHTDYNLAEARVLYELATSPERKAKDIASTLSLDQAYLSRILTRFEERGLIKRKASKQDGRASEIDLTRKGRAAFENLNSLSDKQARKLLEALPPADRVELIHSMKTIERLLTDSRTTAPLFVLRPHRPGDMGWIVHREAEIYADEYGWDATFELLVARIAADFLENFDPARERCWIAEMDGESVGHVMLVNHPDQPGTAKLRLLLVESCARGKGVGHALVNECIRFARSCGYRKITLWTQSILRAAHRIYEQAGFRLVKEEPHQSFGKDLIGQTWELDLNDHPS